MAADHVIIKTPVEELRFKARLLAEKVLIGVVFIVLFEILAWIFPALREAFRSAAGMLITTTGAVIISDLYGKVMFNKFVQKFIKKEDDKLE